MAKQKMKLYYVEGGDTLNTIANRFNTTVEEIFSYNWPWLYRLTPGLKLWVPDNRIGTKTSSVAEDIIDYNNEQKLEAEDGASIARSAVNKVLTSVVMQDTVSESISGEGENTVLAQNSYIDTEAAEISVHIPQTYIEKDGEVHLVIEEELEEGL